MTIHKTVPIRPSSAPSRPRSENPVSAPHGHATKPGGQSGATSPRVPTWGECMAARMTATEASDARGVSLEAAYSWAKVRSLSWARPDSRGRELPSEQLLILLAEGKTANQASDITNRAPKTLRSWASKRGRGCRP